MHRLLLTFAAATLIFSAGCGKPKPVEPAKPAPPPAEVLQKNLQAKLDQGDTKGAIKLLKKAMRKEIHEAERPYIFRSLIGLMIEDGKVTEAKDKHMAMAKESPAIAEASVHLVNAGLQQQDDMEVLLAWTAEMLEMPFSEDTLQHLCVSHASALARSGRPDDVVAFVKGLSGRIPDSACPGAYLSIISSCISMKAYDLTHRVIDEVEGLGSNSPQTVEMLTLSRLRLHGIQGKWDAFMSLFEKELSALSDTGLSRILSSNLTRMRAASATDQLVKACTLTLEKRKPEERCTYAAARQWMKHVESTSPDAVPALLRQFMDKGLPTDKLVRMTRSPFYSVLDAGKPESLKQMVAMVEELLKSSTEPSQRSMAQSMILDGSFILEDYDKAIQMLEQGIDERDESWHKSAIAKLKAHRALAGKKPEEAVKYFREFMDVIRDTMDKETDPSSGMVYTVNWCLARNLKRIGDIQGEAGMTDEAKKSYADARQHFKKALEDFKDDSREHAAITKEMADCP